MDWTGLFLVLSVARACRKDITIWMVVNLIRIKTQSRVGGVGEEGYGCGGAADHCLRRRIAARWAQEDTRMALYAIMRSFSRVNMPAAARAERMASNAPK